MALSSRLAAAVTALFFSAIHSPAKDPPKARGLPPLTYDVVVRGEWLWFGEYDADGNFIPEPSHQSLPRNAAGVGGPYRLRSAHQVDGPSATAEHRSGRLILGTMVKGVFVPEIGSKVIDIHDFDLKKPDRIVWNMYDTAFAFWTEERRSKLRQGALPKEPEPPAVGSPDGWKLLPFREDYPDKKDPWQVRIIGDVAEFGHLDERGEFIPEHGLPLVARSGLLGSIRNNPGFKLNPRYYTLPVDGQKTERVYEYRSGRLIMGTLHDTGNFVPEIGSKVIEFRIYEPMARWRIYNLPGILRRVDK